MIGRFPPDTAPDADRAAARALSLALAGYAVETLALSGEGHGAGRFDRAFGLRAINRGLAGFAGGTAGKRRLDLVVIEPEAIALRRPDSLVRLGVLCLQLLMLWRLARLGRKLVLGRGSVSAPGMPRLSGLAHLLLAGGRFRRPWSTPRLDARRLDTPPDGGSHPCTALSSTPSEIPSPAQPPSPSGAPLAVPSRVQSRFPSGAPETQTRDEEAEIEVHWSNYLNRVAALSGLLPVPKTLAPAEDVASGVLRAVDQWAGMSIVRRRGLLAAAADARSVSARMAGLDRIDRAALVALERHPAWVACAGGPPVARWMTHLAEEASACGKIGVPASTPPPAGGADGGQPLAAFRLVSWAESALASWPGLARRRAHLVALKERLEGMQNPGAAMPLATLQVDGARLANAPPATVTRACFWRALARRDGFRHPLSRQDPPRDRSAAPAWQGRTAGERTSAEVLPALEHLIRGGDPFRGWQSGPAALARQTQPEAPFVAYHGRGGALDPVTRALLRRMARPTDARPCSAAPTLRWRRSLHLIDLPAEEALRRLLEGRLVEGGEPQQRWRGILTKGGDPRAAVVLMLGRQRGDAMAEAMLLAMVDAIWCTDTAVLAAFNDRHPAPGIPCRALGGHRASDDAGASSHAHPTASQTAVHSAVLGAGSHRGLQARRKAVLRNPAVAEAWTARLRTALVEIDVAG